MNGFFKTKWVQIYPIRHFSTQNSNPFIAVRHGFVDNNLVTKKEEKNRCRHGFILTLPYT
ncbi:MAG: hypothetical protein RL160_1965 [Bacteroidota bacterium]